MSWQFEHLKRGFAKGKSGYRNDTGTKGQGFDDEHVFLAESLSELINCKNVLYNRRLRNEEFLQLWNTAMLKQSFYKNTYFVVKSKSETAL